MKQGKREILVMLPRDEDEVTKSSSHSVIDLFHVSYLFAEEKSLQRFSERDY